jgi:hypothetical protein
LGDLILNEDRKDCTDPDREIHTLGPHVFGPIGKTNFDYDCDTAFQQGHWGQVRMALPVAR